MEKRAVGVLLVIVCYLQLQAAINGAVYKVGDSVGWTTIGNFDYKRWAATKTFQLGDIILFEYHPQFHNVMHVNHTHFTTCNTSAPYITYTTGNDSITITTHGHHFYICGFPGHCQSGQKVDINVRPMAPTPAPMPSSVPATPSASEAARPNFHVLNKFLGKLGVAMAVFAALVI